MGKRAGVRFIDAAQAAGKVRDGDLLIVGGNGGTGAAEAVLAALAARFDSGSGPFDLCLMHITGLGTGREKGLCHLAKPGMVATVMGGHFGLQLPFMDLIESNQVDAYNFPQGVMTQLCRAMAAKQPGVLTHVGLMTYMDPRQEGGRMNARTVRDLVELVPIRGEEWLLYRAPKAPDVAIIRGTTADEDGYVSMEHEGTTREDLSIAQAVHNAGGTVICQVKRVVKRGTLHPQMVKIPGFLVDYIVVDPEQSQTYGTRFDPARCGETRVPASHILPDPHTIRRVIARRAAFELQAGDVVNLGVGISAMLPNVAAEEGIDDLITFTIEAGVIGGVPGHALEFGTAVNPRAIIDQGYQFDFYDGGGLDCAFLSFAEVDAEGNINVTRFGGRHYGSGGFIDITQNARRLVFSGTMTGGSQDIDLGNGGIDIRRDGAVCKFVEQLQQVSFSAALARARGQEVVYITERGVFRLGDDGLVLCEIAPGIDLDQHVQRNMRFPLKVATDLRRMDPCLFRPGRMGLAARFSGQNVEALAAAEGRRRVLQ